MTGVQTDTDFIFQLYLPDNGRQFIKRTSYFRTFACHGLQQYSRRLLRGKKLIEQLRNQFDAFFCALTGMAARMKVI